MDNNNNNMLARLWLQKAKEDLAAGELCLNAGHYSASIRQSYGAMIYSFHSMLAVDGHATQKAVAILRTIKQEYVDKLRMDESVFDKVTQTYSAKSVCNYLASYEPNSVDAFLHCSGAKEVLTVASAYVYKRLCLEVEHFQNIKKDEFIKRVESEGSENAKLFK